MKLAKTGSLTGGVLVFLSVAFDGCPKKGLCGQSFNAMNAMPGIRVNSRMNIDKLSGNLHVGVLASHSDSRIQWQPLHCKLEYSFTCII